MRVTRPKNTRLPSGKPQMCSVSPTDKKLPGTPQGAGGSLWAGHLVTPPGVNSSPGILGILWVPESASVLGMVPAPACQGVSGSLWPIPSVPGPPATTKSRQEAAPKLACQVSAASGLGSLCSWGDAHIMEQNSYSHFLSRNQEVHP